MSMKNSNDTIGNPTRDPPTFSAVPQPTAPPRFCTGPFDNLRHFLIRGLSFSVLRPLADLLALKEIWQYNII